MIEVIVGKQCGYYTDNRIAAINPVVSGDASMYTIDLTKFGVDYPELIGFVLHVIVHNDRNVRPVSIVNIVQESQLPELEGG